MNCFKVARNLAPVPPSTTRWSADMVTVITVEISTIMTVPMSADHRVVDGGTGAKFLQTLKQFIEEPASMLL